MPTVYLDPGHGGKYPTGDPGAVGPAGTHEAHVNLAVAMRVFDALEAAGLRVGITRSDDRDVSLDKRYYLGNAAEADIFLSIHCNSAGPTATGTEVWIRKQNASYVEIGFAARLSARVAAALNLPDRGVKQKLTTEQHDHAVLAGSKGPAALIELGFLSNPAEEQLLNRADAQQRAADAIVAVVLEHFGSAPKPAPSPPPAPPALPETQFPDAQAYVMDNGISDGQRPKDPVTREEVWEMLRRYDTAKA